ncbi:MAG: hypothetical protein WC613_01260 [Candidatus Aenigmatarchaeota archaeon]
MSPEIHERVKVFALVRDIPYHIGVDNEPDLSCGTKNAVLAYHFSIMGLKTRCVMCEFRWEDMELPNHILELPHDDPEKHEYLEVLIPETAQWVVVDPTWDSNIHHPSFRINEWDGITSTPIAVPVLKTYSPEESQLLNVSYDAEAEHDEKNKEFLFAMNQWINEQRKLRIAVTNQ